MGGCTGSSSRTPLWRTISPYEAVLSPFVLRLSKDGRRFGANEGPWFESLTTNGIGNPSDTQANGG